MASSPSDVSWPALYQSPLETVAGVHDVSANRATTVCPADLAWTGDPGLTASTSQNYALVDGSAAAQIAPEYKTFAGPGVELSYVSSSHLAPPLGN